MEEQTAGKIVFGAMAYALIAPYCLATDGYFVTGTDAKQQGQDGAEIAHPGDSLGGAINPTSLFLAGNRFDVVLTLFRPIRYGNITGNQLPPGYPDVNGTYDANRMNNFFLPELRYSRLHKPNLAFGVAIYRNGGLDTSFTKPIPLFGSTRGGVDLYQLYISPTVALKAGKPPSFGGRSRQNRIRSL